MTQSQYYSKTGCDGMCMCCKMNPVTGTGRTSVDIGGDANLELVDKIHVTSTNVFITLYMLTFIPLYFLCTHFWQLVHCIELLPMPLPQTPHDRLTAFCVTFYHSLLIITLVLFIFDNPHVTCAVSIIHTTLKWTIITYIIYLPTAMN